MMRKAIFSIVMSLAGAAHADDIVIAALGDSLTQGYGLVQEQGFVPQLQSWLDAQGAEVRLINAGVSGDTTAGGLSRVEWTLTPDVDGMIVTLGGNDLLRGIAPDVSRANLAGILTVAEQKNVSVLVVGMEAPGNFGPEYKAAFDRMYAELAGDYDALLEPRFFDGLDARGDASAARTFMQSDGIHPNAQGVQRIVEAIGPRVLDLVQRIKDTSGS